MSTHQTFLERFFLTIWYSKKWWTWLVIIPLLPLSFLYLLLFKWLSSRNKKHAVSISVPIVVVGNITVGGTGKTPLLLALAHALSQQGITVGIISRGYRLGKANTEEYPVLVNPNDNPAIVGDEPLMMAQAIDAPVIIGRDRIASVQYLQSHYPEIQLVLSDDGLQHYQLQRDMEIIVVDGNRGLGNHLCLPAGPLREPASRLFSAQWIVRNGGELLTANSSNQLISSSVKPVAWKNILTGERKGLGDTFPWENKTEPSVKAVAGIGNPQRFLKTLDELSVDYESHIFSDHHLFVKNDFAQFSENDVVIMTEKDAVKCQAFAYSNWWALCVEMEVPEVLIDSVKLLLNK